MTEQSPLELSFNEKFEKERYLRILEEERDPKNLREIAKNFLHLWMQQKAAARWALREAMTAPARSANFTPLRKSLEDLQ